jgi:hypothetical protein
VCGGRGCGRERLEQFARTFMVGDAVRGQGVCGGRCYGRARCVWGGDAVGGQGGRAERAPAAFLSRSIDHCSLLEMFEIALCEVIRRVGWSSALLVDRSPALVVMIHPCAPATRNTFSLSQRVIAIRHPRVAENSVCACCFSRRSTYPDVLIRLHSCEHRTSHLKPSIAALAPSLSNQHSQAVLSSCCQVIKRKSESDLQHGVRSRSWQCRRLTRTLSPTRSHSTDRSCTRARSRSGCALSAGGCRVARHVASAEAAQSSERGRRNSSRPADCARSKQS